MNLLDYIVLVGYLFVIVGWGCLFARSSSTSEQFMSAGRGLPGWVVGLSIFGSYVSSISFLANPGKAYSGNWNPFVFSLSLPLAAWIATRWFVPFFRKSGEISAYLHLEHRFGAWARTYGVVCYLLTQLGRLGAILYLLAMALEPMVGLKLEYIILISGFVVTIYPFFGGSEGVIWTGAVQAVVLVAGVAVCLVTALLGMNSGPAEMVQMAAAEHKFSLGSFSSDLTQSTFWVVLFYGLANNLQNFGIDQSYVQRYITAKSDRAANLSVWMGAISYIPLNAALLFIGTTLWVFYQMNPGALPTGTAGDKVFPHFISHQLAPGMTGLVLAAICSAAMDSNLNCCATLYLCDIHRRYFRRHASEFESMWVLRLSVLIMGAFSTGSALMLIGVQSALDVWWDLAGILGGGILGLFLLGLIFRRANGWGAGAGTLLGVLSIIWMTLSLRCAALAEFFGKSSSSWAQSLGQFFQALVDFRIGEWPILYKGHSFLIAVIGPLVIFIVGGLLSFIPGFRRETPYQLEHTESAG